MTGQRVTRTNESEDVTPYKNGNGFFQSPFSYRPSYSGDATDEPRWWSRLKGIFSHEDNEESPGSGFIKQNNANYERDPSNFYSQNNFSRGGFDNRHDSFDDFGFMSPFKMMREFERMFQDDFDFHQESSGSRPFRDEDEFIGSFFGRNGDSFFSNENRGGFYGSPFNNFEPSRPRFVKQYYPSPGYPNSNFPNNNNFTPPSQNQNVPETTKPEVPKVDTAASRAKAKIYDV